MFETDKSRSRTASLPTMLVLVGLGAVVLTLSSYVAIPIGPVPITMQTLAVTAIGALYGPRLGAGTVLGWLALGAMGIPVFASGAGGLEHLRGATAGYLWAFPVAAGVTGWLVARGWNEDRKALALLAMLIGNLICLTLGASWLAVQIGPVGAIEAGFLPFLVGAGVKAGLGVGVLLLANKLEMTRLG